MTGGPFAITILQGLTSTLASAILNIGNTNPYYHRSFNPMTKKQIRDLQAFAVELAKEGRKEAAKEVLALIANA